MQKNVMRKLDAICIRMKTDIWTKINEGKFGDNGEHEQWAIHIVS